MSLLDAFRPRGRKHSSRKAIPIARSCPDCGTGLPEVARFCFLCGRPLSTGEHGANGTGAPADLRDRLARALADRYEVRQILGAGGMGAVFLADDLTLERQVAIKVLPPELTTDPSVVQRFRREAKTAARLDHPHIIPIYGVESAAGLHYIVMKLVPGRSLDSVLNTGKPLPLPFALRVLREAGAALGHAHKHGIVHRDVKPANIMLDGDDRVVLTDFGISKLSRDGREATQLTQSGSVIGTPHYMAPEQALGHPVDGRADQYALAVVGFQMLTGGLPFDGDSPHAIIHRHINHAAPRVTPLRPDAPAAVGMTIARAMSKAPSHRFATMEEFVGSLDADVSGMPALRSSGSSLAVPTPAGSRTPVAPTEVLPPGASGTATTRRLEPAAAGGGIGMWMLIPIGMFVALIGGIAMLGKLGDRPAHPAAAATAAETARLSVAATPSATVYLDGKRIGSTPISGHALPVGRTYSLRVERPGYVTRRETIVVAGTASISRKYTLERARR